MSKNIFDGEGGVKQVPLKERPKDIDKVVNTDRASKKLQTDHIKFKADELTQDGLFNDDVCEKLRKATGDCAEEVLNNHFNDDFGFIEKNELSPTRYLEKIDTRFSGILEDLKNAHDEFLKAKYELYKTRGEFYSDKENWDKCKEKTGKQSDTIFKEYFQSFDEHRKLMTEREKAEFKYEQSKRVFEILLK
ncbi:hypothetical protein MARBORIA2_14690 [Methanobrevibacter arboriphilus]|jgi:hypothetical protein|uniref:hypothetical protein n=1 Tax=Methanobrevibacter arboriphilus TaxID=39441 RepID=UPI0022EE1BAB|nr:hypothetical protein [Methanobrevibacter arboriphilus]GLI12379.1 hypothetical protein MARBORIA2_14690 [Methanobrevibacter arboriphilus]